MWKIHKSDKSIRRISRPTRQIEAISLIPVAGQYTKWEVVSFPTKTLYEFRTFCFPDAPWALMAPDVQDAPQRVPRPPRCFPDAFEMPSRCLSQMPLRSPPPDASQMLRPDASPWDGKHQSFLDINKLCKFPCSFPSKALSLTLHSIIITPPLLELSRASPGVVVRFLTPVQTSKS